MSKQVQKLTIQEKQSTELAQEVFILIRLIDMLEKCAQLSDDKIKAEDYTKLMTKQLEKYKIMAEKIEGYDLQQFVNTFNLEDCKFGIDRIKAGPPKVKIHGDNSNQLKLVKDLAQLFFQFQDVLLNIENNPEIAQIKPLMEQLIGLLDSAVAQLPPYNSYLNEMKDQQKKIIFTFVSSYKKYLQDRQILEQLNEKEFKELTTLIDLSQKNFLLNK